MPRRSARLNPTGAIATDSSTLSTTASAELARTTSTEQELQPNNPVVKRRGRPPASKKMESALVDERRPLLDAVTDGSSTTPTTTEQPPANTTWAQRNQWIVLAMASGACAAFNGAFAKLTTTELTSSFSQAIARLLHLTEEEKVIEVIVRGIFFGLNLVFNGVMWTLFTQALARGHSTTQVSIMNTSSNFVITAMLGFVIFSEALPPMWWVGAGLLVAGNVIIGRKDESGGSEDDTSQDTDDGQRNHEAAAASLAEDGLAGTSKVTSDGR
ncbi:hypothetical protein B0T20DRAFT_407728 [Sordaria brevicollis]|uniref:Uncharacterized protein n=1 Tax=Sordaria brevicollis TaxID=83679 RepID=A0AAE0PHP1_SORBR|nr:hypothetical protein B0T20DRAFT_407728 [Sordaria brevicollis]